MNTQGNVNDQVRTKIEEIAQKQGVEIVDYKLSFFGSKYSLRCLVDYPNGGITIERCAALNRQIFSFLEQSKLLGEDFVIEVNSPGIDRVLKNYKDFLRLKNNFVGVWFTEPIEGKIFLEGELVDVNQDYIALKVKDGIHTIEFSKVKAGKARF